MENDIELDEKTIRRKYGDKRIITVVLGAYHPRDRKFFHCVNCGKRVFDYYSELRLIIEGEMREVERPVDIMCGGQSCKTIYRIV